MVHERARGLIEKRINLILDGWSFENRKVSHPEECICYREGKCHGLANLNCFFCFCPNYDLSKEEGGCKIGNPYEKGKWFFDLNLPKGKIWDCSDCTWPHERKNVRAFLLKLFKLDFCY